MGVFSFVDFLFDILNNRFPMFFLKLGFDTQVKYVGLAKYQVEPSRFIRNWVDPIIFAVIAASIIRGYTIEAFTIPTSSLEKSLMVGDFLFVNKFAYGPKISIDQESP